MLMMLACLPERSWDIEVGARAHTAFGLISMSLSPDSPKVLAEIHRRMCDVCVARVADKNTLGPVCRHLGSVQAAGAGTTHSRKQKEISRKPVAISPEQFLLFQNLPKHARSPCLLSAVLKSMQYGTLFGEVG